MHDNLQPLYVSGAERDAIAIALTEFSRNAQITRDRAVDAGNHALAVSLTTQLESTAAALARVQSAAPALANNVGLRLQLHGGSSGLLGGSLAESRVWSRSREAQMRPADGMVWDADRRQVAASVVGQLAATIAQFPAPDGHQWKLYERHELTWFMGGPGKTVSAFLEPLNLRANRASQTHGEIRVSLDEPRADIFLGTGPLVEGQHRSVFADGVAHASGKTHAEALQAAKTVVTANMIANAHVSAPPPAELTALEDDYEGAFRP
ncbi:hypothetical protein QE400_000101 [Xanthomonas sacchari]|uniref:hypothetical protein n=1 Tax=Xanthomonas sacchari TaxID=56458 RepID=UPI002787596B|nr:hypothetical protein [Xanthomonas sacchari]MDQ1090688.1 hypothetical protein [Xanthomonas sacchari]